MGSLPGLPGTVDDARLARAADMLIRGAQEDIEKFARLVMKTERGQHDIDLPPHQRIGLRFMWDHSRSVNIWPINHAKSFNNVIIALYLIGKYPASRGAIVSATQAQAKKLLNMIADYIERSPLYRSVFPGVVRGPQWTNEAIVVSRPPGIKDPTCAAFGIDGGVAGSRLDWAIVDDLLNFSNTRTKDQRDKTFTWVDSSVVSRMEGHDWSRLIFSNSAWNPDDPLHRYEKQGYATLRMQVDGNLYVRDDARDVAAKKYWDHPLVEPIEGGDPSFGERLRIKGKPEGDMLWDPHPEIPSIEWLRQKHPVTQEFNRLYMSTCRDEDTAYCKAEWVEQCKRNAFLAGHKSMVHTKKGGMTFTGVDLAVSPKEGSDDCALFTFEILPGGKRLLLDVDIGKYDGPTMVKKIVDLHNRYDTVIRVENNAAQDLLLHFLRKEAAYIPVRGAATGRAKAHPEHGVIAIFTEMANGAWLIPSDKHGKVHPHVQRWIDECLYYVPSNHTGDALMASWIAREQAREWGMLGGPTEGQGAQGSISASIMSR